MDRPRKTLVEFSRAYLRSLECPAIVVERDDCQYAAHVARGMKKANLVLVPTEPVRP